MCQSRHLGKWPSAGNKTAQNLNELVNLQSIRVRNAMFSVLSGFGTAIARGDGEAGIHDTHANHDGNRTHPKAAGNVLADGRQRHSAQVPLAIPLGGVRDGICSGATERGGVPSRHPTRHGRSIPLDRMRRTRPDERFAGRLRREKTARPCPARTFPVRRFGLRDGERPFGNDVIGSLRRTRMEGDRLQVRTVRPDGNLSSRPDARSRWKSRARVFRAFRAVLPQRDAEEGLFRRGAARHRRESGVPARRPLRVRQRAQASSPGRNAGLGGGGRRSAGRRDGHARRDGETGRPFALLRHCPAHGFPSEDSRKGAPGREGGPMPRDSRQDDADDSRLHVRR